MKKIFAAALLMAMSAVASSQIQYLRYNDDFTYLNSDSSAKTGLERLKYIPIIRTVKISLGGELREQLQWYDHINFGDVPRNYSKSTTWQLWHRIMAHTSIDIGRNARIFTQLSSTLRFLNPNPLSPEIDQNELSLHQAFAEYRPSKHWMARIGRQEISYGNHGIITFREGPNTRLTFDAAILRYVNGERKADLLAISPVISRKGIFDDESLKDLLLGIYATEPIEKNIAIDYYLLHFYSQRRKYDFVSGTENREVMGLRLFSRNRTLNYEIEGSYQFGSFDRLSIQAYGISADLNYRILHGKPIILGLSGNYLTGDKDKNDNQLNTYNLLYAKPQYGLTAPIGATNMITVAPYLKASPTGKTSIYLAASFLWRQSDQDGVYSPAGIELRPAPYSAESSENSLGALLVLEAAWTISPNSSAALDASRFVAGKYVMRTGAGKDINYLSLKLSFKF